MEEITPEQLLAEIEASDTEMQNDGAEAEHGL